MKKIFFLSLLCSLFFVAAQAQNTQKKIGNLITDTASDTLEFRNVPAGIVAIQATLNRASGSVTGKVYLEGAIISGDYVMIDSITVTNKAENTKVFPITNNGNYLSYRFRVNAAGSQTSKLEAAWLKW